VRPEARRQGIVSSLWEKSVEVARNRNYEQMVAEAGGPISQAVFKHLGFDEVANVAYQDFKFQGETPFAELPRHGFEKLAMFHRRISSNLYV
jgi:ribosomal protein S18 acetylase RimI-like enzyme